MRLRSLLLALATVAPLPAAASSPVDLDLVRAPSCPARAHVADLGWACVTDGGLFEIFDGPTGRSLGTTHGPDPIEPQVAAPTPLAATEPRCISSSIEDPFVTHVIYARALDDSDLYTSRLASIRATVRTAIGTVDAAAAATGATGATLKVLCDGAGEIIVANEILPTLAAEADFSTITRDLTALGYADARARYWVLYDDPQACACGGTGHFIDDDQPGAGNANNGNGATPMFAVNFGYTTSSRIWLHELGHNLGAVQFSAPNSTLAGHCIDGRDTMCYSDGGPRGSSYSTASCAGEIFDCGSDDYFNMQPEPGSYLDRHWNLGSLVNRYLVFTGVPVASLIDPAPAAVYRGCAPRTPSIAEPIGRTETRAPIVVERYCARLTVDGIAASSVRILIAGREVATSSTPSLIDPATGQQTWVFEGPHQAKLGTRFLTAEITAVNGFRLRLEHPVEIVG